MVLLFGSQKRFAVNYSWNRRDISCTSTMGLVLRELLLHNHCCCCCFFFSPHIFYSTPIAPVCTTSRHRDPEPWGTQNATATSTHRRPITTTWGWVTLKESQKPRRGTPVSDKDTAELQLSSFLCSAAGTEKFTPASACERCLQTCTCLALYSLVSFLYFLPVLPFSPPFNPWGLVGSSRIMRPPTTYSFRVSYFYVPLANPTTRGAVIRD